MTSESPAFIAENMLRMCLVPPGDPCRSDMAEAAFFAAVPLTFSSHAMADPEYFAAWIRQQALEQSCPEGIKNIKNLLQQLKPFLPEVEERLENLKEAFLVFLRARMHQNEVSPDFRLILELDVSGQLRVLDRAHPQVEKVEKILSESPALETALREIARHALLLSGLQDLESLFEKGEKEWNRNEIDFHIPTYHVCLSGTLSHFYFPGMGRIR